MLRNVQGVAVMGFIADKRAASHHCIGKLLRRPLVTVELSVNAPLRIEHDRSQIV